MCVEWELFQKKLGKIFGNVKSIFWETVSYMFNFRVKYLVLCQLHV